jgi:hypothetical protein
MSMRALRNVGYLVLDLWGYLFAHYTLMERVRNVSTWHQEPIALRLSLDNSKR